MKIELSNLADVMALPPEQRPRLIRLSGPDFRSLSREIEEVVIIHAFEPAKDNASYLLQVSWRQGQFKQPALPM